MKNLALHVIAMHDDSYLTGHPEFNAIVAEAVTLLLTDSGVNIEKQTYYGHNIEAYNYYENNRAKKLPKNICKLIDIYNGANIPY